MWANGSSSGSIVEAVEPMRLPLASPVAEGTSVVPLLSPINVWFNKIAPPFFGMTSGPLPSAVRPFPATIEFVTVMLAPAPYQ